MTGRAGGGGGWWIARAAGVCCGMARGYGEWMVMPGRLHKGGVICSWILCISPQSIDIATFFSQLNIDKMVILFNTMPAVCN